MSGQSAAPSRDVSTAEALIYFFGRILRAQPGSAALVIILTAASGVAPAAELAALAALINAISSALISQQTSITAALAGPLLTFLTLRLAAAWATQASEELEDGMRDQIVEDLNSELLRLASAVDLAAFEHDAIYDDFERVRTGQLHVRLVNLYRIPVACARLLVTILSYAGLLLASNWTVGIVVLCAALTSAYWKVKRARERYIHDYGTLTPTRRRLTYVTDLLTSRPAAHEVRIFRLFPYLNRTWANLQRQWKQERLSDELRETGAAAAASVAIGLSYGYAIVTLAWLVTRGVLSIGVFAILTQATIFVQRDSESLLHRFQVFYQDALFARNLLLFMRKAQADTINKTLVLPHGRNGAIKTEGVWFRYPNASSWALQDISLQVNPGEWIAVVGPNGAGKSTLFCLLSGLYAPTSGQVLIDGVPVHRVDPDQRRQVISGIFQNFQRFELSLRESVAIGRLECLADDAAVGRACERAGLAGILARLPSGLDTVLGSAHGGTSLSGGEWQMVALARAYVSEAAIYLLDEPAASLDPLAERDFYAAFLAAADTRTVVFSSHRVASARLAQRIVVLEGGRITAVGTHEQLLSQGHNWYARAFKAQQFAYVTAAPGAASE